MSQCQNSEPRRIKTLRDINTETEEGKLLVVTLAWISTQGGICPLFACVYAMKSGCSIKGYMDKEGELNGKKAHCPIYAVMCISAKCKTCGREGGEDCKKVK